jgi:hypothetical protein
MTANSKRRLSIARIGLQAVEPLAWLPPPRLKNSAACFSQLAGQRRRQPHQFPAAFCIADFRKPLEAGR